jgi:hypothetical protein
MERSMCHLFFDGFARNTFDQVCRDTILDKAIIGVR